MRCVHRLREMFDAAANGVFPPVDGRVEVLAPGDDGHLAIVEFTGHAVVLAPIEVSELIAMGADGYGAASHPRIKLALAGNGGAIGCHDAVMFARGTGRGAGLRVRDDLDDHPRVVRSRAHRTNVQVLSDDRGLITIGDGLVGRRELSIELFDGMEHRARAGRELVQAALDCLERDEVVWAQVSPGNAASMRTFLACGFTPVAAETLIVPAVGAPLTNSDRSRP